MENKDRKKVIDSVKKGGMVHRMMNGKKKKKISLTKIFVKAPKDTHVMKNGNIMSGKVHSKDSKLVGKIKKKNKRSSPKQLYNPISKKKY